MFSISCVIIAGLSTTLQPTAAAVAAQVEQQSTPTQGTADPATTSSAFVPPADGSAVWSCYQNGSQCKSWPGVFEQGDIASWDLMPNDFPNDCQTMDYDFDPDFPEGVAASACTWMSGCKTAACEGKCVANVYQELNDQYNFSPGQLDREQNAIYRDTAHVWGLSCSLLSSEIYRLAAEQVGGTPQMDATSNLLAPGMGCPSDADIDSVAAQMETRSQEYKQPDYPYTTTADSAIWPFSYQAAGEVMGSSVSFVGDAKQAKDFFMYRCTEAIVSNVVMEYVIVNTGWEYNNILNAQGYMLEGMDEGGQAANTIQDEGVTLCRENKGNLEELIRHSVAKPGQAEAVQGAISDLPAAQCMGISYASKIDSSQPWLAHGMPGSCKAEVEYSLRQMYSECAQLTSKDECVKARFDELQWEAVAYLNAHHSEVSTSTLTDQCMIAVSNPWTGVKHSPHSNQNSAVGEAASWDEDESVQDDVTQGEVGTAQHGEKVTSQNDAVVSLSLLCMQSMHALIVAVTITVAAVGGVM